MLLNELRSGEQAILLGVPDVPMPCVLRSGSRVEMIFSRPELSVVTAGGTGFALSAALAGRIVVVRAPV